MRVNEEGKCIKHGFGQVVTTHVEVIREDDDPDRIYHEVITTETTYIGYWVDDQRCGLGKQHKKIKYKN